MPSAAADIEISGMVQGVGYRYFCFQNAMKLNLNGWVKNNFDGSVSIAVEGERGMIEELIKTLRVGPPASAVRDVNVSWQTFQNRFDRFEIAR